MKIALIAHDGKKADMVDFVLKRLPFFLDSNFELVATGTTGEMLKKAGVESIKTVNSGPLGGDAEIGSMVSRGEINGVIFFRDPLDKHPHDVDIAMLMRLCDVHNIPLATNYNSACAVVEYLNSNKKS